jgi:L-fucose isomerase-like protein
MTTLGVIVGTRGFFPSSLCESGRAEVLAALEKQGIKAVILPIDATPKFGAVESLKEARACADLFIKHKDEIEGVLVTLPNFGDERAISNVLRWADLKVPVLVHAWSDDNDKLGIECRRDSFCGKMSCCNNLRQYGIAYSLTTLHTDTARSTTFTADLKRFVGTCKVVKKLKNLRVGALGARPAPFNTVRFSEKLMESAGISVETMDLSEMLGWVSRMKDQDGNVKAKLEEIRAYTDVASVPE